ncbi:Tim44/TimA family putative adaptor protein [Pararhizobium mangrovi]|uniref:Tim44 domain-containing protein n=1 Tax=Pararhizobium mangrovi TaxID=2590452 RepID=A0A506U185_9HYPH|nr:Tim44/TimA family putative adaptor protein [Pararhizobium mangrovi]TPW27258.1 Tim44 domain-containing protein [Pararhizobium mangrovi]
MGSFDLITLLFFVAAVIVFLQLRAVLGRRTGNERPPMNPYQGRGGKNEAESETGNVVALPRSAQGDNAPSTARLETANAHAEPGTKVNDGLRAIITADPSFDPQQFVDGAKMAYEMIVSAYADADRKTLKNLLSKEVYDDFVTALNERESKGEVVKSSFVGVDKAKIVHAEMKGSEAILSLRLVSQLISATYDREGNLIDGDPDHVGEVTDVWSFSRDTRSRDPNWKLVATESEA